VVVQPWFRRNIQNRRFLKSGFKRGRYLYTEALDPIYGTPVNPGYGSSCWITSGLMTPRNPTYAPKSTSALPPKAVIPRPTLDFRL